MDQNTQILLAVFAGISLLLAISGAVFAWRAMNTAARRRFNPRLEVTIMRHRADQLPRIGLGVGQIFGHADILFKPVVFDEGRLRSGVTGGGGLRQHQTGDRQEQDCRPSDC